MKRLMMAGVMAVMTVAATGMVKAQVSTTASHPTNATVRVETAGATDAVTLLYQAGELVRYARDNEAPVAMLAAVQMLDRVRVHEDVGRFGRKHSGAHQQGEEVTAAHKRQTPAPTLDAGALLAEARSWAATNADVRRLLDARAAKPTTAPGGTLGATQGPVAHRDVVQARRYDDYAISFRAGEVARVAVIGDGDTDLDLHIFDEHGNEITKDIAGAANGLVTFTPKWTGQFRVRVVNNGYVYNQYLLTTN